MYFGYILPLIIFYSLFQFLKLVDSILCYHRVQETTDAYLLCQRLEDLEIELRNLKDTMIDISKQVDIQTDIHEEYVKLEKHRQDIQSLKDHNTILEKDIQKLQPKPTEVDRRIADQFFPAKGR